MPDIGPLIEQGMESLFTETETTTQPEIDSVTHDKSVSLVTTSQSTEGSSSMMVTSANVDSGVSSTPLSMVSITVTTLSPLSQDKDDTAEPNIAGPDNVTDSILQADNENRDDINSKNQENNSDGDNEKEEDDETPLISNVVNDLIPVLQDQEFVQMLINFGPILNIIRNMFFDKPAPNEISI